VVFDEQVPLSPVSPSGIASLATPAVPTGLQAPPVSPVSGTRSPTRGTVLYSRVVSIISL
jgi:hypothetical protein